MSRKSRANKEERRPIAGLGKGEGRAETMRKEGEGGGGGGLRGRRGEGGWVGVAQGCIRESRNCSKGAEPEGVLLCLRVGRDGMRLSAPGSLLPPGHLAMRFPAALSAAVSAGF